MKTIDDLISIPEVETVIQVSSIEAMNQDELKKRIVDSFILTEDILRTIEAIYFTLRNKTGCGILIKGNYGSGKSHLLAFLGAMLTYPSMIAGIKKANPELSGLEEMLLKNMMLPITATLTDYSSANSLSEIITGKISEALQKQGMESILNPEKIVSDFNRLILPNIKNEFQSFAENCGDRDYSRLSHSEQAGLIFRFLKEKKIPFRPFYDYQEFFDWMDNALKGYSGVFLLVDELSEFLRARSKGDLVSEDIRFIQFLGERAKKSNICIAFSMQEAIEEAAEISADGLNRIKDRYPVRINLTSLHLKELVEKRLLLKKPEALPFIDDIYLSMTESFPGWNIPREDFRAIYPVHPATFTMLEGITGIFSKTRGMVDFIYTEVKGDQSRGIKGIMGENPETLLQPDRVFDHFRNNLEESMEYNKLLKNIYSSFERDIPKIFSKAADRDTAVRIIKIILLYQILPGNKKPTAKELAHLVLEARFKLDPEYNYAFIRDKILKEMERQCTFLGVEKAGTSLEDRFFLLYKESPVSVFENKVRQFIAKNVNIGKQAMWFFISRLNERELPLSDFKESAGSVNIHFENTIREGLIYLRAIENLADEDIRDISGLATGECDFALIIGFPVIAGNEDKRFKDICSSIDTRFRDSIFYWKPAIPSDPDMESLVDSYAKTRIFEDGNKDEQLLSDIVRDAESKAFRIIKNLYSRGVLFSFNDSEIRKNEILLTSTFEKTIELFARDSLKKSFPSHSRIAPSFEIGSIETYRQIILLFRERGEADFNFEGSRAIMNATDAILKNSALLKIIKNVYSISPDPSKNVFIKDLLYEIEQKPGSFSELYLIFRKGKYGVQKEIFSLYLFFLAYAGFISIEKSGRTLKTGKIDLNDIQSSDKIRTGEGLSPLFIERHNLLGPFAPGLDTKNIHLQSQREVWERLVEFKRDNENDIREMYESINSLETYPAFKDNTFTLLRNSYERLIRFISSIKVSKQSKEGFDSLLEALEPDTDIVSDLEINNRYKAFLSGDLDRITFIYRYITDPDIYIEKNEGLKIQLISIFQLFNDLENLIAGSRTGIIIQKFNEFKESYKSYYLRLHKEVHSSDAAKGIDELKLTPAYRILYNLACIETISVKDDLIKIDSLIRTAKASVCRRSISSELDMKPYCECRLKSGESDINSESIRPLIKNGISQYISAIKDKANIEKIRNYMAALMSSSEDEQRDMLKVILEIDIEKSSENDLVRVITPEAIDLINRALSGNIKIIKKELRDLYNLIYGRRFRKHELMNIFNEWLDTESGNSKEELIYDIAGFDEEKRNTGLPPVLQEEVNKAIKIDDDNVRLQAFGLALLLYDVSGGKYFNIINKLLFIDLSPGAMKEAVAMGKKILGDGIDLSVYFAPDILNEIVDMLELSTKTPGEISELFKASSHLSAIRKAIAELFLKEEIRLTDDLKKAMYFDDSVYSKILSCLFEINDLQKEFLYQSGRTENFNPEYFYAAFELLFMLEKIQWISLNNNILIERIQRRISRIKKDILGECNDYFSKYIGIWERDKDLKIHFSSSLFQNNKPVVFIFDSLRTDLFIELNKLLRAYLNPGIKKLFIASYPSDTMTFREEVLHSPEIRNGERFKLAGLDWIFINAAERDYRREELWSMLKENAEGIIISFSLFDEKIHYTKQGIVSLAEEMEIFCKEVLIPILKGIPEDRGIYITADHGFIEHSSYTVRERYSHGGNSFFERIIPFARYTKK